jgi:hypothetical protein
MQKTLFGILIIVAGIFSVSRLCSQPTAPVQPEFTSFQEVGDDNLVETYTGAFNYNLLLMTVPGENGFSFPINISYTSDTDYGKEASWVGYGWTLNNGVINRFKRGLPDDYNGTEVKYWTKDEPITCHTAERSAGLEFFSIAGISGNIAYNSHSRMGTFWTGGIGISAMGLMDMSYGTGGNGEWSGDISFSPMGLLSLTSGVGSGEQDKNIFHEIDGGTYLSKTLKQSFGRLSTISMSNYTNSEYPSLSTKYSGGIWSGRLSARFDPIPKLGVDAGLSYTFSKTETDTAAVKRTYGYMYSENALADVYGVMDYHVEKDMGTTTNDLKLGVPFSNKDIFMVSGHGISGSFSAFNGQVSSFRPD